MMKRIDFNSEEVQALRDKRVLITIIEVSYTPSAIADYPLAISASRRFPNTTLCGLYSETWLLDCQVSFGIVHR